MLRSMWVIISFGILLNVVLVTKITINTYEYTEMKAEAELNCPVTLFK